MAYVRESGRGAPGCSEGAMVKKKSRGREESLWLSVGGVGLERVHRWNGF